MSKFRKFTYLLLILISCNGLTGCVVLAAGAGAAVGYVAVKHYDAHQTHAN